MHIQRTSWAPGARLSLSFFALGDNNQRNKPTYDQQGCTLRGTRKQTTCLLNIHEIVRPYVRTLGKKYVCHMRASSYSPKEFPVYTQKSFYRRHLRLLLLKDYALL